MLPSAPNAGEEDPTTQMTWPGSQNFVAGRSNDDQEPQTDSDTESIPETEATSSQAVPVKHRMSTWNLITLSISMAGAQIAWTVELGYGTPFLLGLGLSEQLTSLVWLAGPISGLIAQPVIGAVSDASTSKYRRRYWVILSTIALVVSTLTLAYCETLAAVLVHVSGRDGKEQIRKTAIGFAIVAFYILDFALNALQASLRNLLLDITPAAQLNSGNAWHGRMTNAGNIIGYGFGFLPLAQLPLLRLLGGGQFRKFCIICIVILVVTVGITCFCHDEQPRQEVHKKESKAREVIANIYTAIVNLPRPIRRVCYVQLFAFMGWFPFLFYSTTYIGQIMAYEKQKEPDAEYATRMGERAMLIYSVVAVAAGTVLPHLANRDRRLMAHKEDVNENAEISRIRATVRQWRAEAARKGRPLRLPVVPFLLRNIWMGALLLFSVLTFSTFFITTVVQATIFVSLVGICWAVAMWAPFAIIMEFLKELQNTPPPSRPFGHARALSHPGPLKLPHERQPLLRARSVDELNPTDNTSTPVAGGTILGVHNLAIVAPQLIVALVTSAIFQAVDGVEKNDPSSEGTYLGKNGVAWVLRFGGAATLIGAVLARRVPPTPTEKAMRRRLSEMRDLQEGGAA